MDKEMTSTPRQEPAARDAFEEALDAILEVVRGVDPAGPEASAALERALPPSGEQLTRLGSLVRQGVEEGWLAPREHGGIRFGRVRKAAGEEDLGVECVHMAAPGPGHTHPHGEIDLCFAVEGDPTFDGGPPGWCVYPPGSWHVPTVTGGTMDILYFLPGGAIRFEPKP